MAPKPEAEAVIQIPEAITPAQFCWRYAVGCLPFVKKLMEQAGDKEKLALCEEAETYIGSGHYPEDALVQTLFPKPFKHLESYKQLSSEEALMYQMKLYWRLVHRGPSEDTPSIPATVATYRQDGLFAVRPENELEDCFVENQHKLILTEGMRIMIHVGIITEIFDWFWQNAGD